MSDQRSTAERGYGREHRAERQRWEPLVALGDVRCQRCAEIIPATAPWDLGHNDERTAWTGPEHVACNRGDGGRRSHQSKAMTVRDW